MNIKEQGQDKVLFIAVIALISFGLFMLFSASWVKSLEITGGDSRTYFLVSQLIKLIPAFFIFVLLTKINYRKLQFLSPYLLLDGFSDAKTVRITPSAYSSRRLRPCCSIAYE